MSSSGAVVSDEVSRLVLSRAKAAIATGDQTGALALLHVLVSEGAEVAATLTPELAQALIATARAQADEQDRQARLAYEQGQRARAEICSLLQTAPLDTEDLHVIRDVLAARQRALQDQLEQRLAGPQPEAEGGPEARRLGIGWLERYWVSQRWGPYLRLRWREGARKRVKYIGKAPTP